MKDAANMTDAELSKLIEQADLMDEARKEQERRRRNAEGEKVVSVPTPRVTRTTKAPCPSCGKRDAVLNTKPMYANGMLGKDGKPTIGTLAYCKCGARYNAGTGERVGKAYTY